FPKTKIKIPYYILQNYAKTRDLDIKDIRYYLDEIIYHKISTKEKAALKRFIKACKALNLT
ncbi:menaquinone via futalosine step 1, partial [Campylobacter coli]